MESSENSKLVTESEAVLKECELPNETIRPLVISESLIKVNGDYAVPSKLFQTDENSCESTNSSSSHTLIIDHQEEFTPVLVKNAKVTETSFVLRVDPSVTVEKEVMERNKRNKRSGNKSLISGIKMKKIIKRKPADCKENGTFVHETKKLRLEQHYLPSGIDASALADLSMLDKYINRNNLNENKGEENKKSQEEIHLENNSYDIKESEKQNNLWQRKLQKLYMEKPVPAMLTGKCKDSKWGNYSLCYKPNIKYKCFKCFNDSFLNLIELREHQKSCLFNDFHRNFAISQNNIENIMKTSNVPSTMPIDGSFTPVPSTSSFNSEITHKMLRQQLDTFAINDGSDYKERVKKRIYLCAACGKYFENWNLFIHMRGVHNRHVCLYCFRMFPTAEKLTLHLEMKHDLEQNHFECQDRWLRSSRDTCYLMCCICEYLFTEQEEFSNHICAELITPCRYCGLKGQHSDKCKLHLKNRSKTKNKLKKENKSSKEIILNNAETIETIVNTANCKGSNSSLQYRQLGTRIQENICDNILGNNVNSLNSIPSLQQASTISLSSNNSGYNWDMKVNGCFNETETRKNSTQMHHFLYTQLQIMSPITGNKMGIIPLSKTEYSGPVQHHTFEDYAGKIRRNGHSTDIAADNCIYPESIDLNHTGKRSNDTSSSSEIQAVDENAIQQLYSESNSYSFNPSDKYTENEKPLTVPKFTIKVPKEYQNKIDSERSSTETDEEDLNVHANIEGIHEVCNKIQDLRNSQTERQKENKQLELEKEKKKQEENISFEQEISKLSENSMVKSENSIPEEVENSDATQSSNSVINQHRNPEILEASNLEQIEMDIEETVEQGKVPSIDEEKRMKPLQDGLELADDDVLLIELFLDKPIDKITVIEFLRICLEKTHSICLYCNHARRIAVNGHSLALHFLSQHRFLATVDSITAEELQSTTIVSKLKSFLPELERENRYLNMETYCNSKEENMVSYERVFECFLCRFQTRIHKELYLHNRKMHLKTAILCFMCRANFYSYSEVLCHMCPGTSNKCVIFDIQFRCCLCDLDKIPSAFRLMVHLRKKHSACDVCLEDCIDQSRLSSHVWKHKLHHLCYRCGIAYRNKPDITKHLFWKHGTESVLCKRCLQKRWPHVYHFCIPPASFVCEICNLAFSKAMCLKVHKRLHTGDAPYPCTEDNCDKKFISRKLLLKHVIQHNQKGETPEEVLEDNGIDKNVSLENQTANSEETRITTKEEENVEPIPREDKCNAKKKKKKLKNNIKGNLDDLINLPAPNLSESDSSDDSGMAGNKLGAKHNILNISKLMLSPPSDIGEDEKDTNPTPMIGIWENLKSFQASKPKPAEEAQENVDIDFVPILHVSQSDHDYCAMFKSLIQTSKNFVKNGVCENKDNKKDVDKLIEVHDKNISPSKKKLKKSQKEDKSCSDTSSSGSSSSSDSSCSCGSNCSCSSSSNSSSDSSSSSDESFSSTSAGRKRITVKREATQENRDHNKTDCLSSVKALNSTELVDVVEVKPLEYISLDPIILESDLETDESNTDEDFYDEHPQKLASQLLADKRKQLMLQTCLSPSHNFDIVENSRPSTPSLPEEVLKEKKVKIKKKKREKKGAKSNSTPVSKLLNSSSLVNLQTILSSRANHFTLEVGQSLTELDTNAVNRSLAVSSTDISNTIAAPIPIKNRPSTGSNSDIDVTLKRSKRTRRPNKFYGYSSDDDTLTGNTNPLSGLAAFKPTPPPNLTWRKEDLPSPSKSVIYKIRSPANSSKKWTPVSTPPLPPIPPIIIRPMSNKRSFKSLTPEDFQEPAIAEATVKLPINHKSTAHQCVASKESLESESSDDDKLQINLPQSRKFNISAICQQRKQSRGKKNLDHQKQMENINISHHNCPSTSSGNPIKSLSEQKLQKTKIPPALLPNPDFSRLQYFKSNNIRYPIRPPAGARPPREGESVYCYCRCPYDEVSEMIACDGDDCMIEWFHFECVGIMVPPKGKWFCAECRPNYFQVMLEDSYENT